MTKEQFIQQLENLTDLVRHSNLIDAEIDAVAETMQVPLGMIRTSMPTGRESYKIAFVIGRRGAPVDTP